MGEPIQEVAGDLRSPSQITKAALAKPQSLDMIEVPVGAAQIEIVLKGECGDP